VKSLESEIAKLFNEMKKNKLPEFNNVSKHDESRIISLYKNGYTIEEIARELRIPAGEVEFIVKFSNISQT
jgi:DNA-binding NarL/FixJ family response regulator